MSRRLIAFCASILLVACISTGVWWLTESAPAARDAEARLPVPPFPPRITEGSIYESCLATLASDPISAVSIAEAWQQDGGGDGAMHCRGLALIAAGQPGAGADLLEQLAQQSHAPPLARALVLGQAVQARLMVAQPARALTDATQALAIAPEDSELMIMRAAAEGALNRDQAAVDDLSDALRLDPARSDALVARAVLHRKMNQLDLAQADVTQALAVDPTSADALLERGILRQRMGDAAGARADWEHARKLDPNSTTGDLAQQNLSLLEVGPTER